MPPAPLGAAVAPRMRSRAEVLPDRRLVGDAGNGRFDERAGGVGVFRLAEQDAVHAAAEDLAELPGVEADVAALMPFTGVSTITVGVRWSERVGPPSARPRMYSARPATSKQPCSIPTLM